MKNAIMYLTWKNVVVGSIVNTLKSIDDDDIDGNDDIVIIIVRKIKIQSLLL